MTVLTCQVKDQVLASKYHCVAIVTWSDMSAELQTSHNAIYILQLHHSAVFGPCSIMYEALCVGFSNVRIIQCPDCFLSAAKLHPEKH